MVSRLGYVPLRDIFARVESDTGISIHGDHALLGQVSVPEGSVANALPALGAALRPLRSCAVPEDAPDYASRPMMVMLAPDPEKGGKDYHCDLRFAETEGDWPEWDVDADERFSQNTAEMLGEAACLRDSAPAAETAEKEPLFLRLRRGDTLAEVVSVFGSPRASEVPERGSLLLRFYRGNRRTSLGLALPAEAPSPDAHVVEAMRYCGMRFSRGSYRCLMPHEVGKSGLPTDLLLEAGFVRAGSEFFLTGSGRAHHIRGDVVDALVLRTALWLDTGSLPVRLTYSPRFRRDTLLDYGFEIPTNNTLGDSCLPEDFPSETNVGGLNTRLSVIDILGEYDPCARVATLFPRMISVSAHAKGLPVAALEKVVEIHELAHAVTHVGNVDCHIWERCGAAPYQVKEAMAQALTFNLIRDEPDLRNAFEKLSEHQPAEYRDFGDLAAMTKEQFRAYLLAARGN